MLDLISGILVVIIAILGYYFSFKKYQENKIESILSLKDRESAGRGVPASGLYLYKVKY